MKKKTILMLGVCALVLLGVLLAGCEALPGEPSSTGSAAETDIAAEPAKTNTTLPEAGPAVSYDALGVGREDEHSLEDKLFENLTGEIISGRRAPVTEIDVGGAVFNVRTEEASDDVRLAVTSVVAHGQTAVPEEGFKSYITGNQRFRAFEANGVFCTVFGGTAYFLCDDGVFTTEIFEDEGFDCYPGNSHYSGLQKFFMLKGDRIVYEKIPHKYYLLQTQIQMPEVYFCCDRDELYRETGTVTVDASGIHFSAEEVKSVSDLFDLDAQFEECRKSLAPKDFKYETIDDLFRSNRGE